jgi:DNA-binding NarL/FixJ family response regulator
MTIPFTPSIRVLIVDDHAVVRAGLRMLLCNHLEIEVVGEAANGASALTEVSRVHPNLIVLDLDLGEEDILDCLTRLRATAPDARILLLTGVRDPELHRQAVRLGAMGLVLKDKAPEVLLRAIERVHAGEVWIERTLLASVLGQMTRGPQPVNPEAGKIALLTEREREVIGLIGEGLRNRQIAERLFIAEVTVRHHLTSIYDKLGVRDRLELVIYAYRHGLIKPTRS